MILQICSSRPLKANLKIIIGEEVVEDQEGITIYINKEPDVLAEFTKRNPRYASGDMMATIQKRFFASIYLYAIAMFFEMKAEPEKRDWAIPNSLKAISKFILDLAFTVRAIRRKLNFLHHHATIC